MLLTRRRALPELVVTLLAAAAWLGLMAALACVVPTAVRERLGLGPTVLACAAPTAVPGWLDRMAPACVAPMVVPEWLGLTAVLVCAAPMAVLKWLGLTGVLACGDLMAVLEWLGLTAASLGPDIFPPVWALTVPGWLARGAALTVPGWVARAVLTALAWVDRVMAMAVPGWLVPVTAARAWVISITAVPA
jgi:hypothetical protein